MEKCSIAGILFTEQELEAMRTWSDAGNAANAEPEDPVLKEGETGSEYESEEREAQETTDEESASEEGSVEEPSAPDVPEEEQNAGPTRDRLAAEFIQYVESLVQSYLFNLSEQARWAIYMQLYAYYWPIGQWQGWPQITPTTMVGNDRRIPEEVPTTRTPEATDPNSSPPLLTKRRRRDEFDE